jgi:hypothetical protein
MIIEIHSGIWGLIGDISKAIALLTDMKSLKHHRVFG